MPLFPNPVYAAVWLWKIAFNSIQPAFTERTKNNNIQHNNPCLQGTKKLELRLKSHQNEILSLSFLSLDYKGEVKPQGWPWLQLLQEGQSYSQQRPWVWSPHDLAKPRTGRRAGTVWSRWCPHRLPPGWLWRRGCWSGSTVGWSPQRTPTERQTPRWGHCRAAGFLTGKEETH